MLETKSNWNNKKLKCSVTKSFTQTIIGRGLSNDNSLPYKLMQMKINHRQDLQSENLDNSSQCSLQLWIFLFTLKKMLEITIQLAEKEQQLKRSNCTVR